MSGIASSSRERSRAIAWFAGEGLPRGQAGGCWLQGGTANPCLGVSSGRGMAALAVSPGLLASQLPACGLDFLLRAGNLCNRKKPSTWPKSLLGVFIRVKSQGLISHMSLGHPTFAHSFKP